MANQNNEINGYSIDINRLNQEVEKLTNETNDLRKQQEKLTKDFKDGKISVEQYNQSMNDLNNKLKQNKRSITDTIGGLTQITDKLGSVGASIGSFAGIFKSLFSGPTGVITALIGGLKMVYDKLEENKNKAKELREEIEKTNWEKAFRTDNQRTQQILDFTNKQLEIEIKNYKGIVESGEKSVKIYQDQLNKLNEISKQRQLSTSEQQRMLEISKNIGEQDAIRLKYQNELNNLLNEQNRRLTIQQNAQDAIKKLQIALIDNEKERKIKSLKYEEEKQIESINKIYDTADEIGKKYLKKQISLLRQLTQKQIDLILSQNDPQGNSKQVEGLMKSMLSYEKFLDEIESEKHFPNEQLSLDVKFLKGELNELEYINESMVVNLNKVDGNYQKIIDDIKKETELKKEQVDVDYQELVGKTQKEIEENEKLFELHKKRNEKIEQLDKNLNERIEVLEKDKQNELEKIRLEGNKSMNELIKSTYNEENRLREENLNEEMRVQRLKLQAFQETMSSTSSILSSFASMEKENSKEQIMLSKASMFMNMAESLAKGMSSASEQPYPYNLVAIGTTIAEMVASFAEIYNYQKQSGFSKGGLIGGVGTGTSDSIPIKVSNGESIMTSKATSTYQPLLSSLNQSVGGNAIGNVENQHFIANEMAIALRTMPNPIVSVESIDNQTQTYNRVRTYSHL